MLTAHSEAANGPIFSDRGDALLLRRPNCTFLVSPTIVIPGRTEGASPEPMNTGFAAGARWAGQTFSECGVPGFRALGFAAPRNDDGGVEAYFVICSPAAPFA